MDLEEKNKISHRSRALAQFKDFLEAKAKQLEK
jgi:inosine/xanthosine triphosphate pyrophosphatase family protein